MPHLSIGLDLGARHVKAALVRTTLRGSELVRTDCEPVELDEEGRENQDRVLAAAGRLVERLNVAEASLHCAVPGDRAAIRKVELPRSAGRRLEQVLKFELDEMLPFDIEEAVFDYAEFDRTGGQIQLLTATMRDEHVDRFLEDLNQHGITPRELGVAPLSYWTRVFAKRGGSEDEAITAIVDIGHTRTNIAVLDDRTPTARTVLRGGRDLTAKLAEVGKVPFATAEEHKRAQGVTGRVGEVVAETLRPLVREIQQTFKGHLASGGGRVGKVLLAGGEAAVPGLAEHLADQIGLPVERFSLPDEGAESDCPEVPRSAFALAFALALREETSRSKRIDLRQGDLAFRGDFELLKKRLIWLAACLGLIVVAWIGSSIATYTAYSEENERQSAAIEEQTKKLFGRAITRAADIRELLEPQKVEAAPIPKRDAYDIVVEFSKRIPESVVHDITFIEIKPKRITVRGVVDAVLKTPGGDADGGVEQPEVEPDAGPDLSPTDLVKAKLEEFTECFTAIRINKVTAAGTRRRYTMEIDSRCP
jgi:general secretion pathway protein L